jgi:predicted enzyme related to lactoylglutathione lyase
VAKVIGIGGVFFKAKDPETLRAWYRTHLGIDVEPWGGFAFRWPDMQMPGRNAATVWSIFPDSTNYFAPSQAPFMINYVVADLAGTLAELRQSGCAVDDRVEESEFGKFGWVVDCEGNRIELWEPPKT